MRAPLKNLIRPALLLTVMAGALTLLPGCANYPEDDDHPFLGDWTGTWEHDSRSGSLAINVKNNGSFWGGGSITYTEQTTTITQTVTVTANINDLGGVLGTVVFDTGVADQQYSGTIEGELTQSTWSGSGTMTFEILGTPVVMTWSLIYGTSGGGN